MRKFRGVFLKNDVEIGHLRVANGIVARILDELGEAVRPGLKTLHFEELASRLCEKHGVRPAFKGYGGFPFALCCSVNEEIVHGFPSERVLQEGDTVSFAMGDDPSAARYSHELMRNHLRQCFENKRLDKFPLPKAKDHPHSTQGTDELQDS